MKPWLMSLSDGLRYLRDIFPLVFGYGHVTRDAITNRPGLLRPIREVLVFSKHEPGSKQKV